MTLKATSLPAALIALFAALLLSGASFAQDKPNKWSSKGNPKTQGHNFTVEYPSDFIPASDFSKDDYLQVFAYDEGDEGSGDSYMYMTAAIQNLMKDVTPDSLKTDGQWDLKKLGDFWQRIAKMVKGSKSPDSMIGSGGIPMMKLSANYTDGDVYSLKSYLFALHGDKMIRLECGMDTFDADPEFAAQDYGKRQFCQWYFSSLEFLDNPQ